MLRLKIITFHASTNVWQDVSATAFLSTGQSYLISWKIGSEWTILLAVYLNVWSRGWVSMLLYQIAPSQPIPWLQASKLTATFPTKPSSHCMTNRQWVAKPCYLSIQWHILFYPLWQFVSGAVNFVAHLADCIFISLWVTTSTFPAGSLNNFPFSKQQKVSSI